MNDIFDILKGLKGKQDTKRKSHAYIYLDEQTKQLKEKPLQDSTSSSYTNSNPAKLICDSIFQFRCHGIALYTCILTIVVMHHALTGGTYNTDVSSSSTTNPPVPDLLKAFSNFVNRLQALLPAELYKLE